MVGDSWNSSRATLRVLENWVGTLRAWAGTAPDNAPIPVAAEQLRDLATEIEAALQELREVAGDLEAVVDRLPNRSDLT